MGTYMLELLNGTTTVFLAAHLRTPLTTAAKRKGKHDIKQNGAPTAHCKSTPR